MPPFTISATCPKWSPGSVAIPQRVLMVGRVSLPHAMSSLPVQIWLPQWAPSHMWNPNSRDLKTSMMGNIRTLWSESSDLYSTMCKMHHTACRYTMGARSVSSIRVLTRCTYWRINCK
jgi:hypothetical protein